jgi:BRO family, N-terminal domain.
MSALTIQVADNLHVSILPNQQHEFLMTSKEVADGYGISQRAINKHSVEHSDELLEGKHFVKGGTISSTLEGTNLQPNQTFWTKRGIVRLGFFIKSERAKQFRDWAEDLVIFVTEKREELLARIEELERQLQEKITLPYPVTLAQLTEARTEYFAKHLRWGDVGRIAKKHEYSYRYVQAVKLGYKRNARIEQLLLEVCNENRQRDSIQLRQLTH